ncbi:DUF3099 domain-containing protein [Phycicoccus sp. CSK15P-2]|uniref:DUF3099 domain-containing protein n=1 Tax=Phycicoccus sp. CSK15P-2 TaxID=2807627 RepID=UPI0027DC9305|nr:DUF3099 domain-containing protein [Phycicoccus sp. CSK15P-2]
MPLTRHRAPDPQSVTTVAASREEDQKQRLKQYLVTMSIRTVCFVLVIVIDDWYRWVFAAAAVFLPFFAVVAANAVRPRVAGRRRMVTPQVDHTPLVTDGRDVYVPPDEDSGRRH